MNLNEVKTHLSRLEGDFPENVIAKFADIDRAGRRLSVYISRQLFKNLKKARRWKAKPTLATLKNISYGFDERDARSRGGKDGVFLLDRNFSPPNEMMRRIYGGYLEKHGGEADELANLFACNKEEFVAVRLVSHHMRIVGVLLKKNGVDKLILVDFDHSK